MPQYQLNNLFVKMNSNFFIYSIAEKLLTAKGKDLSRVLFSLKQIFHEDRELVNGFVELGGLNCLIQIGNESDQNFQNFVLRALGQVSRIYLVNLSSLVLFTKQELNLMNNIFFNLCDYRLCYTLME